MRALAAKYVKFWPLIRFMLAVTVFIYFGIHMWEAPNIAERTIYFIAIMTYCILLMVTDIWLKVMRKKEG